MTVHIGLSYSPNSNVKYAKYAYALERAGTVLGHEVLVTDLFTYPDKISDIDAIVFTGGADVAPELYGKPELRAYCHEIDPERDAKEFSFAKRADEANMPILGICRGLQLLNVHYGGTLIADIESVGQPSHRKIDSIDRRHEVTLKPGTLLAKTSKVTDGEVTSAHHQAIDTLAPGMMISARSSADGIIEAIEWEEPSNKPYFLAVQWHPERMSFDEPLSGRLFESFIWETAARKLLAPRIKK